MSNEIIKDRQVITDDWLVIAADQALPADNDIDIIVPHAIWQAQRAALEARSGQLGIIIGDGVAVDEIINDLAQFALVAVAFPAFPDGRSYSYARLLRERYNYTGEIRAIGNVLRDQLAYMERCGINAFQLESGRNIQDALNAFNEFSVAYQPAINNA